VCDYLPAQHSKKGKRGYISGTPIGFCPYNFLNFQKRRKVTIEIPAKPRMTQQAGTAANRKKFPFRLFTTLS
jgi:hypothetical protein